MALRLVLTPAGRAALRNSAGDGTNAVRIASAGVTATAFAPGQPLPAEIKRLASIAGGATAADTLHVTIRDDGSDVYSVRGFGFYLGDGTLLASYGQADVIVEKSAQAMLQLALDVQFADVAASALTFGDTSFSNPAATTERLGVVELATDEEAGAGRDTQRAITPRNLKSTLDTRLGASAPTDFGKTLLALATAAAFRTALALKGAALKDDGAGNGLDADLLDGQHGAYYRSWQNLTDVPATFPASPHRTDWTTLDNIPEPATRWPAWAEVSGKPVTFAPAAHSHAISDVNNLQTTLDGKATPAQINTAFDAAIKLGVTNSTAHTIFQSGAPPDIAHIESTGNSRNVALQISNASNKGASAVLSFIREGQFGAHFGLDTDNVLKFGGWSFGASAWRVVHEGLAQVTLAGPLSVNADPNFGLGKDTTGNNLTLRAWTDLRFQRRSDSATFTIWHSGNFVLASKQDALGYVPVQQGGGVGQGTNKLYLGWNGNKIRLTVDSTDLGALALESWSNDTFLPRAGGLMSGGIDSPIIADNTGIATYARSTFRAQSNASTAAAISFVRAGAFGVYFGLDTDNRLKVGGWSMGNVAYALFHEGNFNPASKADSGHRHNFDTINSLQEWLSDRPTRNEFACSAGENGWQKLPSGMILQWGTYRPSGPWSEGTGPTLGFPMAFPNACQHVQVTDFNNNVGGRGWNHYDVAAQVTGWSAAQFTTFLQWPGSQDANYWCGLTYFAVGY